METMKFKVGDRVRVKSLEWYNTNKNINGEIIAKEGRDFGIFLRPMHFLCGDVITIDNVNNGFYFVIENRWVWYDWMFEDEPVTEEKQEVEQSNKNDMETKEMTKKEVFAYLSSTKILCTSTEETKKVQEKIFELGIGWAILGKSVANKYLLFINDNRLEHTPSIDTWIESRNKRIEPSEILAIQIKEEEKPKFNPNDLKPFDRVLVRDSEDSKWRCNLFSHIYEENKDYSMMCVVTCWKYCIPYNEETKHLVGTTEKAPEFYNMK